MPSQVNVGRNYALTLFQDQKSAPPPPLPFKPFLTLFESLRRLARSSEGLPACRLARSTQLRLCNGAEGPRAYSDHTSGVGRAVASR
jgi:hypothetical protein